MSQPNPWTTLVHNNTGRILAAPVRYQNAPTVRHAAGSRQPREATAGPLHQTAGAVARCQQQLHQPIRLLLLQPPR